MSANPTARPAPRGGASPVDDALLDHYWEQGYAVVRKLFDAASLERWIRRLEEIVEGRVPPAERMLVMRDVMVAKGAVRPGSRLEAVAKIQDYEHDPELWSYAVDERLLACVERFVGHDVFSLHTMLINKPPNVDGRHPLHQDLLYFPFRPADRIVAAWTALEPVTVENGCLVVVPGSHEGELLPHEDPDWEYVNAAYWGARGVGPDERRVHLEMDPGDTVFFHPLLLHGSGRNRTQGFRRAISAHFASLDCTWEWTASEIANRPYKIVRGEHAGEFWNGERTPSSTPVNPLDFIPARNPLRRREGS